MDVTITCSSGTYVRALARDLGSALSVGGHLTALRRLVSDVRGDYVVREERTLPAAETTFEVELGDTPSRVHLLGRARDGRLVRRAIISALTAEGWDERWQRRASAS